MLEILSPGLGQNLSNASIDLTNLPAPIQKLFHFDPVAAQLAKSNQAVANLRFAERSAAVREAAIRQQREAIIRGKVIAGGFTQSMRVIQNTDGGLLVDVGNGFSMFLTDYPGHAVDDNGIRVTAYHCGDYVYRTVMGSQKTVMKITCDLDKAVRYAIDHDDGK